MTTTETVAAVADFLRERLEEDAERAAAAQAQAAQYADGKWFRSGDLVRALRMEEVDAVMVEVHADPERVTREVEAARGVLALYDRMTADLDSPDLFTHDSAPAAISVLSPVLCHLARAYADHPGYRADEWTPEL